MHNNHAANLAALAALMGFLLVLMLAAAIISLVRKIRRASFWPETTGRVIASGVETTRKTPKDLGYNFGTTETRNDPFVEYEYKVHGRSYRCRKITVGVRIPATELEATLERYPVGKTVKLFYDPANPLDAVLERTLPMGPLIQGGVAFVFFVLGVPLIGLLIYLDALEWLKTRIANPSRAPLVGITALLGIIVTLFTVIFANMVRKACAWPTTKGIVTSAEIEAFRDTYHSNYGWRRTFYKPVIIYSYEVKRHKYSGDRLTIGVKTSVSMPWLARRTTERYPVGTEVIVYYDPRSPGESVLNPRSNWHYLLVAVLMGLFAFSGALAIGRL